VTFPGAAFHSHALPKISHGAGFISGEIDIVTGQLVKANLDLERPIPVLLVELEVRPLDEGNLLVGRLGAQYVAQRDILEPGE